MVIIFHKQPMYLFKRKTILCVFYKNRTFAKAFWEEQHTK